MCCWKRVFAMTSAFSWQNSISLCPASFRTPRPNVPVTPGVPWLLTFAFQSPIMKSDVKWSRSVMSHSVAPWTVAYQAPLSMGFSRQEYWSGLPFPSPGIFPTQGSIPVSHIVGRCFTIWATREVLSRKGHLFWVLALKDLVALHRTIQSD